MPLTIYKSSAGSGKTYTLVLEYVKLVIQNPNDYRNILAITFTNKASDEMKSRIIQALSKLTMAKDPNLEKQIYTDLWQPDETDIEAIKAAEKLVRQNARYGLYNILHNYSEFGVSTIDSFFQKILRHFAKELKLPMRYEVEMDTAFVLDEIVKQLMLEIGHIEGLTKWLEEFAYHQIEEEKGWKIERNIKELGMQIFKESVWEQLNQASEKSGNEESQVTDQESENEGSEVRSQESGEKEGTKEGKAGKKKQQSNNQTPVPKNEGTKKSNNPPQTPEEKQAIERAARSLQYDKLKDTIKELWLYRQKVDAQMKEYGEEGIKLIEGFGLKVSDFKMGTAVFFDNIQKGNYEVKATLAKIHKGSTANWCTKSSPVLAKIEQLVDNGLQNVLVEAIDYFEQHKMRYISASEVLKNIYVYGILNDLRDKLRDYRTENNLMLISDTNNVLRSIIQDEDTPFIFEKVGTTYKHVLIDEFQDTSDYQWLNLLPLVKNVLGTDSLAMVVGDVKQSIYRWRGGNMKLLLSGIKDAVPQFYNDDHTERFLDINWRSQENVVAFNNAFFQAAIDELESALDLPDLDQLGKAYGSVAQQIQHNGGGFVQFDFISEKRGQTPSWKEQVNDKLLPLIETLQIQGFSYKDLAILVRRNTEGSEIAQLLGEAGIKVVSSDSLLLKNSAKVRLLISLLYYLSQPHNVIAQAEILANYLKIKRQKILTKSEEIASREQQAIWNKQMPNNGKQTANSEDIQSKWQPINDKSLFTDHKIFSDHLQPEEERLFNKLLPEGFTEHIEELVKKPLFELVETLIQLFDLHKTPDAYIQRFQDLILEHTAKSSDIRAFLDWWTDNQDKDKTSIIVPEGENAITIMTVHKAKGLEFPVVLIPYCDWSLKPKPNSILWVQADEAPYKEMGAIPLRVSDKLKDSYFADYYRRELLDTYIDNLNLLYVAFTRPVDRLYVFTKKPGRVTAINSVSQLLDTTLKNFTYADHLDDTTQTFRYPAPISEVALESSASTTDNQLTTNNQQPTTNNEPENSLTPLATYISNDYHEKITIRSDSDRFFMLFDNEQSEAIKMGQKIHAVLEKIVQPDDVEKVMRKLQMQGIIQTQDQAHIRQRVNSIFEIPKVQSWFSKDWEVLAERSLLRTGETYIPDRVLLKNNEVILIDYKTVQIDTDRQKQMDKHKKQVNRYANILKGMGYKVAEKYLLYIGETAEVVGVL